MIRAARSLAGSGVKKLLRSIDGNKMCSCEQVEEGDERFLDRDVDRRVFGVVAVNFAGLPGLLSATQA